MASRPAGAVRGFRCGAGSDTDLSLGRVASSLHVTHSFDATTPFGLLGRRPVVPPHCCLLELQGQEIEKKEKGREEEESDRGKNVISPLFSLLNR